jgi:ATP-dependent protease ClpP protease subunit
MTTVTQPSVPGSVRYVSFSADINLQTAESLIGLLARYTNEGVTEVHLLLSTRGGDVMYGMTLYSTLRAFPFTLVTHNVGNVNSIGNAVFLAGDHRETAPHATFMFHGVGFDTVPGQRLERKVLRECLNGLQADEKRISEIFADRTTLSLRSAQNLFREARTKDASYAKANGIVHNIKDIEIPPGVLVDAFTFNR